MSREREAIIDGVMEKSMSQINSKKRMHKTVYLLYLPIEILHGSTTFSPFNVYPMNFTIECPYLYERESELYKDQSMYDLYVETYPPMFQFFK